MMTDMKKSLVPLLESKQGIYLTAYLVNRGDLVDLKIQLQEAISEAYDFLFSVQTLDQRKRFMEPLVALMDDARILQSMTGNVGIFRNDQIFRILNIPVDVERQCFVADSFHVKPLLRWIQSDQDFMLLGVRQNSAELYWGNQNSIHKMATVLMNQEFKSPHLRKDNKISKKDRLKKAFEFDSIEEINHFIDNHTLSDRPKLFIVGEPRFVQSLIQELDYDQLVKYPIADSFHKKELSQYSQAIRNILKIESQENVEKTLLEFRFAESENRVDKNIFQISKAVVKGQVRKLIVTDELSLFGKIDPKSGDLQLHPYDLDHEDDCVLDDLAQMVLNQGGEVIIAKRDEIPKGRPILALLADGSEFKEKNQFLENVQIDQETA